MIPALLTKTSIEPNVSLTSFTKDSASLIIEASDLNAFAFTPNNKSSCSIASAFSFEDT